MGFQAAMDCLVESGWVLELEVGIHKCVIFIVMALCKKKFWAQDRLASLAPVYIYKYLGIRLGAEGGDSA